MGDSSSGLKARPHKAKAFRPWLARRQSCGLKGRSRCFILTGARDLSGRFQTAARGDRPEGLPFAHPGLQPGTLGGIPSPGGTKRWKPAVKPPDLRSHAPSAPQGREKPEQPKRRNVLAPLQGAMQSCRPYRWFQALTRLPHTGYLLFGPPGRGRTLTASPSFNRARWSQGSHRNSLAGVRCFHRIHGFNKLSVQS